MSDQEVQGYDLPKRVPLYKDKLFLVLLEYIPIFFLVIVLYTIGVFENSYFSFGPNPALTFFHVVIDNWHKWGLMVVVRVITVISQSATNSVVSPWIITSFQSKVVSVKQLGCSVRKAILIVNLHGLAGFINGIFDIWIIFTQVDLAFIEELTRTFIINFWTIPRWLEDKADYEKEITKKDITERTIDDAVLDARTSILKEFSRGGQISEEDQAYIDRRIEELKLDLLTTISRRNRASAVYTDKYTIRNRNLID
jgi:hypothetical protein